MDSIIKKLLLEIMYYSNNRKIQKSDVFIQKAQQNLGDINFYIRSENLLNWIDPKNHFAETDLEKYLIYEDFMDIEDFKEIYNEYDLLFKHLPELSRIFKLKEKHIEFNPNLSKEDINEIYQFVKTNYSINPARVTRYIKPKQ